MHVQTLESWVAAGLLGCESEHLSSYPGQQLIVCLPAVFGQVVTPTRVGQTYTYSPGQHNQQDLYDVPPIRSQGVGSSCTITPGSFFFLFFFFSNQRSFDIICQTVNPIIQCTL